MELKVDDTSEVNPDEKSLTNELALIKHTTAATYKSFITTGSDTPLSEEIINKTRQIII